MTAHNAFTIDVEDYFQVSAFEAIVSPESWNNYEFRVERNIDVLLEMLEKHQAKATFFTLGWVADKCPSLIRQIADQGHEVASHGYWHQRATGQSEKVFFDDVSTTRKKLQDLSGQPVNGYRAPSFSIDRSNEWAYEMLAKAGYSYSSSIYPVNHDHYGVPDAPRFKYKTASGLWEVPLSTLTVGGKNIPISGGGYFRLYPYLLTSWAINRFHRNDPDMPYIFYMHPWEVDPEQPRLQGLPLKSKFRHYLNLHRVEGRLEKMLSEFKWQSLEVAAQLK